MLVFVITLSALVGLTVIIQLLTNMKIVGGNELGIVSGSSGKKGFRTFSGGRAFIVPLLQRFGRIDLTPITIEVVVDSAIAVGVVPLNVKATVSFAIASNEVGRSHAVTRILGIALDRQNLIDMASSIIEGHLRDSIASMSPEQVMKDKDVLVAKMINVCKNDLENIGLEITTMNIADVDDHRLPGVEEPDLYIALLKRVQTVAAETKARQAQAEARAASVEQQEARRSETTVKNLENELERLRAEIKVKIKEQEQKMKVGVEQANADARARVSGIKGQIEAEKQKIEMLANRLKAEVIVPASAQREKAILDAQAEAARVMGPAKAELEQLEISLNALAEAGPNAMKAYLVDNFEKVFGPFAETLGYFPAKRVTVLSGASAEPRPLSAVTPDALSLARNDIIAAALANPEPKAQVKEAAPQAKNPAHPA